jgi:haloalkane dehalogenase
MVSPMMKRMVLRLYRATDPEVFIGWEDELLTLTARVPTIVLWGDHDPYIAEHFAERFGAQTVQHFPDCGHWIANEATDEVLQWLEEFLTM